MSLPTNPYFSTNSLSFYLLPSSRGFPASASEGRRAVSDGGGWWATSEEGVFFNRGSTRDALEWGDGNDNSGAVRGQGTEREGHNYMI